MNIQRFNPSNIRVENSSSANKFFVSCQVNEQGPMRLTFTFTFSIHSARYRLIVVLSEMMPLAIPVYSELRIEPYSLFKVAFDGGGFWVFIAILILLNQKLFQVLPKLLR